MPSIARAVRAALLLGALAGSWAVPAAAQVDRDLAQRYFEQAGALCRREGGRLWGVSLCGPMVFADAASGTIATNEPEPDAPRPPVLGFANAALRWGDRRWSTFVWRMIPSDSAARGRLLMHELFHRVQPDLGLLLPEPKNDHLETVDGRYFLQLEWRALARALATSGADRARAIADALGFRAARRARFDQAAENERRLEINEGLAQYTGTVVALQDRAGSDVIEQLAKAPEAPSLVRTFAYPSGAAWGLLLDEASPGWPRRLQPTDDLATLLQQATGIAPTADVEAAAARYDGPPLLAAEKRRAEEHAARVADLRRRFVDGPVLRMPKPKSGAFLSLGVTAIPEAGTVLPSYRATAPWGKIEAEWVLISADQATVSVPAPASIAGPVLHGDGWTIELAEGWAVRPGPRPGDYRLVPIGGS